MKLWRTSLIADFTDSRRFLFHEVDCDTTAKEDADAKVEPRTGLLRLGLGLDDKRGHRRDIRDFVFCIFRHGFDRVSATGWRRRV